MVQSSHQISMRAHLISKILFLALLVGFFVFLYKIYIPRITAFGCFDDCFNYGAGYFLTRGKQLYSDIFYNHQPLPAYISAVIQQITKPENIYELLLRSRQFVFIFAFIWEALLIMRFGIIGLAFAVLYELTKFYAFGDRFLAEGLIVYPFVYMTGVLWKPHGKKLLSVADLTIATLSTWFVIFMREPYIPAVLLLYGILLMFHTEKRNRIIFAGILIVVSIFTILALPFQDYFFNVVTVNKQTVLADTLNQSGGGGFSVLSSFIYPVLLLLVQNRNIFHQLLTQISVIFLGSLVFLFRYRKYRFQIISTIIILGLANLRIVPVGTVFYESFHLLPWYAMFLFTTVTLSTLIFSLHRRIGIVAGFGLAIVVIQMSFSPQMFFRERIDTHAEFITNYGSELQIGNVAKALLRPEQSLFLDGWAELIYWQADRISPYQYAWYTSVMPFIPRYKDARLSMFKNSPPDMYYGTCPKENNQTRMLPETVRPLYVQLQSQGKPTCVWIKKAIIPTITDQQWQKAAEQLYDKPL